MNARNGRRTPAILFLTVMSLGVAGPLAGCGGDAKAPATTAPAPDAAATRDAAVREHALAHAKGYTCPMHHDVRSDTPGKCPICGMDLVPVADAAPEPAAHGTDDASAAGATVSVSTGMRQALGVRTAAVERGPLARRVEAVATVAYDARGVREVRVRAEGWVESLQVRAAGERVRAGQTLFTVYSPKLATTRQDLERAKALNDPELVAAAEARLKALGAAGGHGSRVAYAAPVDGVLSELMVYEGTMITPEMVAARITPLGKVWVVAAVPESASGGLAPGASATLRFAAYPGETLQAKVTEVLPELDAATRTVQARLTVENADARLRPGMIGTASIDTGTARDVVQVPLDAVIRTGRGERVVVALGDGRFATHEIVTGLESGDRVEVTRGLAPGDEVVVSGQFLIDSESNVRSSLSRLNGDAPAAGASAPGAAGSHAGHGAPEPRP
jgi:Cu(I)/Ag(I) efflux system membrane fusion protein